MTDRIRALIFDFDDTIVGSETLNAGLLREFLLREYSVALSPEQERETYWYSWKDTFPFLARKFGISESFEEIWPRFFETKRRWLASHRMPIARGTDLILSLPVPRAIVSGSMRGEIELMMANVGLGPERFDVLVSAEDCERRKPDPEGFLRALDAMKVRAGEALVFEDSPLGIEAARACGLPVAFMREFAASDACAGAQICFDTFEQAYPWVRERVETAGEEGRGGRGAPVA
jgi:beta-phosphoglucomutase-like phosphatase (HAD superfamily)